MPGQILGLTIETWSAVGSVAGGAGGLIGFATLGLDLRRRLQAKKLAPAELMPLLIDLRTDLNTVIASGGQPPSFFLDAERQKRDATLAAWLLMLNDKKLHQLVADAQSDMTEAWAWSHNSPELSDVQEQTAAARRGVSHIERALTRIGELSRKYG